MAVAVGIATAIGGAAPLPWVEPAPAARASDSGPGHAAAVALPLPRMDVVFRADEVTPANAAAAGERATADLEEIERLLGTRVASRIRLHLHGDAVRLRARTGSPAHVAAVTLGRTDLHVVAGDSARHEVVHAVARAVEREEGVPPPAPFWEEGVAMALGGGEDGIPSSDWAAVYRRVGLLPSAAALLREWPDAAPRGPHPYHVAGSLVEHVVARRGIGAVVALLRRPDRPAEALGGPLAEVESAWRAGLLDREVDVAREAHVRARLALPTARLPEGFPHGPWTPLLVPGEPGVRWSAAEGAAWEAGERGPVGRGARLWALLHGGPDLPADVAVRFRYLAEEGAAALLRLHRTPTTFSDILLGEGETAATLRGEKAFVQVRAGPRHGREVEAVIASSGGDVNVFLDGWLVLSAPGAFHGIPGGVSVGVKGGRLDLLAVDFAPLPRAAPDSAVAPASRAGR